MAPFGAVIYDSALLGTALTYGTIVLQAGFPFLILHKRLKWVVAPAALSFHLGIAYFMGLTWFSETMMAAETVFFTDTDYRRIRTLAMRAIRGTYLEAVRRRARRADPFADPANRHG
ncbi:MAG TPA: hypothetical protein VGU66_10405 [Candidatus Elarobacter sp.]|nr:hypothetical protein [Candidatus Elarobacter sp.]